jgi:hypothetical protein
MLTRPMNLMKPVALIFVCSLLVAAGCAGDDEPSGTPAAGKGGRAGSKTGASSVAGLGGEGGRDGATAADVARAREMCSGSCAVREFIYLTGLYCEPGSRLHYNDVISPGEGGAPASEAPRSSDQECIDGCMQGIWSNTRFSCWQAALAITACDAEGVWICGEDGTWGDDCSDWAEEARCPE